jgi:hypothetical protein
MERGGERRPGLQQGDAREAGGGSGEAGPTGRGVGRRRRRSNPNPEPRAIKPSKKSYILFMKLVFLEFH